MDVVLFSFVHFYNRKLILHARTNKNPLFPPPFLQFKPLPNGNFTQRLFRKIIPQSGIIIKEWFESRIS